MPLKIIFSKIELKFGRSTDKPPAREDFKSLGDYMLAKTIYKRFPKTLNAGSFDCNNGNLSELWEWADGEKGVGFFKDGYKLLSETESRDIEDKFFKNSAIDWLLDFHPFFSAPNGYYICLKDESGEVFAYSPDIEKFYLLADTLESYFQFLLEIMLKGLKNYHDSDPEIYSDSENKILKSLGFNEFHPLNIDAQGFL